MSEHREGLPGPAQISEISPNSQASEVSLALLRGHPGGCGERAEVSLRPHGKGLGHVAPKPSSVDLAPQVYSLAFFSSLEGVLGTVCLMFMEKQ